MKSIDMFFTALVIIIVVLSITNTILYLRREKRNGRSNHNTDNFRDSGNNGEN